MARQRNITMQMRTRVRQIMSSLWGSLKTGARRHVSECIMSHMQQNHGNGHDMASATENGKGFDFDKIMPTMVTPTKLTKVFDVSLLDHYLEREC